MIKLRNIMILTMMIFIANKTAVSADGYPSVEKHKDIWNKCGLGAGNEHYHHGYKAHSHTGGVCKYIETEKQNWAQKHGNEDGYENGYLGLEKEYKYKESDAYYAIYKKSYDEKYTQAKNKAESESSAYYDRGRELGKNGESLEGSYTNKIFDKAYKEGYKKGYEEYKSNVSEEYRQKGINDGISYLRKISFDNLEEYMIEAYESGYNEGFNKYKNSIINNGYSAAFGNGNEDPSYTQEEKDWYKEGFDKGNNRLEEIKAEARKLGLDGEDETTLDRFTEGKYQAIKAYEEGKVERLKLEEEKKELELQNQAKKDLFKYITIAIGFLIVSIVIFKFTKKKK
ncbi:MAG: hypothetical protein IJH55_08720 [Romboutsia sp.]|nr:hypothetical protein [Romboutsia sp.]